MKRELFVMVDTVSGLFGEPFTMANVAEMRRQFDQIVQNPAVPNYAIRDTVVVHLGTLNADIENPCVVPAPVATVVLRGDAYNVEEIRKQNVDVDSAASELLSRENR